VKVSSFALPDDLTPFFVGQALSPAPFRASKVAADGREFLSYRGTLGRRNIPQYSILSVTSVSAVLAPSREQEKTFSTESSESTEDTEKFIPKCGRKSLRWIVTGDSFDSLR